MNEDKKPHIILTSSFNVVATELMEKSLLPTKASVAFITTAGDPYPEKPWIDSDRQALLGLGYQVTDLDIKKKDPEILEQELAPFGVIFIAGGNTTYLVEHAHLSGLPNVICALLNQGKVYIGSSAGSVFAGPTVSPFVASDLSDLSSDFSLADSTCLNLVDYIVLPHDQVPLYKKEHERVMDTHKGQFTFIQMTDNEYKCV